MTDHFDELIEQELNSSFALFDARPPIDPRYRAKSSGVRGWRPASILASLPTILTTKVAVALAAATLVGTGVAAKTAFTGTPNPLSWGSQVQQQVEKCQGNLASGPNAVGRCVPPVAPTHGAPERVQHDQTPLSLGDAHGRGGGSSPGGSVPSQTASGHPPGGAGGDNAGSLPSQAANGRHGVGSGAGDNGPLPTQVTTEQTAPPASTSSSRSLPSPTPGQTVPAGAAPSTSSHPGR